MTPLIASCVLFLGLHWLVSGSPLREPVVRALGENRFRAVFSLSVLFSLIWMGFAYAAAPYLPTWGVAQALKPVTVVLMVIAVWLFAVGVVTPNPTTVGQGDPGAARVTGVLRILRHPGLFAFGLWGLAHFIVRGDWASHLLYGTFAFQGLVGPLNMERKYRRRHGAAWQAYAQQTSYLPFGAILAGRNRLVIGELSWKASLVALVVFALLVVLHRPVLGVSPLP